MYRYMYYIMYVQYIHMFNITLSAYNYCILNLFTFAIALTKSSKQRNVTSKVTTGACKKGKWVGLIPDFSSGWYGFESQIALIEEYRITGNFHGAKYSRIDQK